jgi:hypothetical protein
MSKITELASGQITNSDAIVAVLSEPDDMPASVIIHRPTKPTVLDRQRFSTTADGAVKVFAAAVISRPSSAGVVRAETTLLVTVPRAGTPR